MIVQMQFRRGTSAEWSTADPVLAAGEPGYDTTVVSFKIGDGVTHWDDLPYQTFSGDTLTALIGQVQTAAAEAEAASASAAAATAAIAALPPGNTDPEVVRDTMNSSLVAGPGITISPNDAANTTTISAVSSAASDPTPEFVYDTVAPMLVAGSNITITKDDTTNTFTFGAATTGAGVEGTSIIVTVASADAPLPVKSAANFVCDGVDDGAEINQALALAAALTSRNAEAPATALQRGKVQLSGGRFNIANANPIKMQTGTWLTGAGFLTEIRATAITGGGIIRLAAPNVHLTKVSDFFLNGNSTAGGSCDGINYDMSLSGNTSLYPDTNPDSYHYIQDLYVKQFTGTAGTFRTGVKLWASGTANNRGNIIDRLQVRDCNGNGIELSAASDSFISNCHVGTIGGSGYRIATGNTKISNCKSFYCDTYGLNASSGRGVLTGFESQDDATGIYLNASPWTCAAVICDTNSVAGMRIGSSQCVVNGLSIFVRGGGRYTTNAIGLHIDAAHTDCNITGTITPTNITTKISGTVGARSFMRVSDGTTLVSAG